MGDENPELTDLISKPDILRIIECPVCHEVPFPPIYLCITGHNICKSCKPKFKNCPVCEKVISDTRNYPLEQMILASTHSCAYKDEGCKIKGTGEVLGDHMKSCNYRSFKCPGGGSKNHCLLTIKLSQAKEHFLTTHKLDKIDSKRTRELPFTRVVEDHSKFKQDNFWVPSLIELDGKSFLAQLFTRNDIMYWTLFCIGAEEESGNYKAEIIFSSEKNKDIGLQWKILVQPIVKSEELRDGNLKDVLIPSCSLSDFKKVAVRDDGASKYLFQTEYKILRRE